MSVHGAKKDNKDIPERGKNDCQNAERIISRIQAEVEFLSH